MSVRFKDYYETLGVPRTASAEEIRKNYRRLARKYHPDLNKSAGAEGRFKELAEAYEVLSDAEKRKKYDALGADWQQGQEFRAPPGWENTHFAYRGAPPGGGGRMRAEDLHGFSDFFETLFGGVGGGRPGTMGGFGTEYEDADWGQQGDDQEADITISLAEAYRGGRKQIELQIAEVDAHGRVQRRTRTYGVKIPPGTTDGARIRLAGQGGAGQGGRPAGDLYLRVHLAPHPQFRVQGHDVEIDLPVTPWEAALGAKVTVPTLDGKAQVHIAPGTASGMRLRLRGKGLPRGAGLEAGDLFAVVQVTVPHRLSARERELFEELARQSSFNPREGRE